MIPTSRLAASILCSALCVTQAAAQSGVRDGSLLANPSSKPSSKPAAKSTARFRVVPKAPVAALEARGANPTGPFARFTEVQRDSIVENTRSLLGIRYKWAGVTPEHGVDCSGLVRYVFGKLGIELPHSAAQLARLGTAVPKDTADMRPGDLLVFSKLQSRRISHVGIYVGDGMMVHASSTSKAVVETPILEYKGLQLRSVRRVFAVDSTDVGGDPLRP